MRYYQLAIIGTGTDASPRRPDLPAAASWVGTHNGQRYLIKTLVNLNMPAVTATNPFGEIVLNPSTLQLTLSAVCAALGFSENEVRNTWNTNS